MYVHVAKTKVLISCEVTAQLICAFVFAFEIKVFIDLAHIIGLSLQSSAQENGPFNKSQ